MLAIRHVASIGIRSSKTSSWEHRLEWLIMQPFGWPGVPEVKKIAARSSFGRGQGGAGCLGVHGSIERDDDATEFPDGEQVDRGANAAGRPDDDTVAGCYA